MKNKYIPLLILIILFSFSGYTLASMSSDNFSIPSSVMNSSGNNSSSGNFSLVSSFGESTQLLNSDSSSFNLEPGFINTTSPCNTNLKGTGFYFDRSFRTHVSINLESDYLSQGKMRFYSSEDRLRFQSTSMDSIDFPSSDIAILKGEGKLNQQVNIPYTLTIANSTNTWGITIYEPGNTIQRSGSLSRGNLEISELCL